MSVVSMSQIKAIRILHRNGLKKYICTYVFLKKIMVLIDCHLLYSAAF